MMEPICWTSIVWSAFEASTRRSRCQCHLSRLCRWYQRPATSALFVMSLRLVENVWFPQVKKFFAQKCKLVAFASAWEFHWSLISQGFASGWSRHHDNSEFRADIRRIRKTKRCIYIQLQQVRCLTYKEDKHWSQTADTALLKTVFAIVTDIILREQVNEILL